MNTDKAFKGSIKNWSKRHCCPDHGLGYIIEGEFVDHPRFAGAYGHTSWVVSHDPSTGHIETRNSRYVLLGEEVK